MQQETYEASTKHEQIIRYIESLKIGTKISVRSIAREMEVSEGTAYKAIKDAENQGIVSTKERIGTLRIEKKERQIEHLTFGEVVTMVDGQVLGGAEGLDKTLNKFVIGAMKQEAMVRYIEPGSLLIVGNRLKAHSVALELGAGVLITGGFGTSEEVRKQADTMGLPIISSSYDTFTVASLINRAIYDRIIKRKALLIEDILPASLTTPTLKASHQVEHWEEMVRQTGHSRFPVVDEWNRVIGMITAKDVLGASAGQTLDKLMTRQPVTVTLQTPVATAAHMMTWEGVELLPVTDANRKLINTIGRADVMRAMQAIQQQPQAGETIEDLIWSGFEERHEDADGSVSYQGVVTPQMTNPLGTLSEGVLTTLLVKAAQSVMKEQRRGDLVMENIATTFIRPAQMEGIVKIRPRILEASRRFGKIDVELHCDGQLAAKALLTVQIMEPS